MSPTAATVIGRAPGAGRAGGADAPAAGRAAWSSEAPPPCRAAAMPTAASMGANSSTTVRRWRRVRRLWRSLRS